VDPQAVQSLCRLFEKKGSGKGQGELQRPDHQPLMTEEAQRGALAQVVNAISQLDITQAWGQGKTSSSDGQRFAMRRKVLQQTYSPKFNDFALEFYSFVADNYAPFFSLPIECTDRDAPYVLDGLLYNESDLPLEEHYTDTHGYTENNFAAFAMFGRRFSPRIRGLHKQRIYRIDIAKDYNALIPLVCRSDRTIHMDWIVNQWDRIAHFKKDGATRGACAARATSTPPPVDQFSIFNSPPADPDRVLRPRSLPWGNFLLAAKHA
jgi:TnpA family transposase